MKNWKKFPRVLFFLTLLISLLAGLSAPALVSQSASAAPMRAAALDVIINEVAWAGTSSATTADEWIELYNATNASIDFSLSSWTLSDGEDINIMLYGVIPAYGYYLLERAEDATDISSDQIYSGILNNTTSVETLTLTNSSSTIDTANGDGGGWNGGSTSPNYYSMERVGVVSDSVDAWTSNDGVIRNGLNADGNSINGTPKQQNSAVSVDLSLSINPLSVAASSGDLVSFTATLTNNSSFFTATGVSVNVTLPSGLSGVSITPSLGTYSSGVWSLASLPPGSATLIISGNALSGGIVAVQISSSNQVDPASSNNSASSTISVGSADLSITNFVNTSAPKCGTNVVFTIEVFNPATGDDATGVQIVDTLPDGLTYISADLSPFSVIPAIPVPGVSQVITWNVGALAKNTSQKIKITAAVKTNTPIVNSASISLSDQIDSNLLNNSANVVVTPDPNCIADLSLSQTWIRSDTAGRVDLQIKVANIDPVNSTNPATNVQVKDRLPSGLTYVSHTSGMTYSSSTGIWSVGTLGAGANSILTITAKAAVDGDGTTNFAEVWRSDQYDPDSTPANGDIGEDDDTINNSGVIGPDVKVADLSLTQTVDIDALGTTAVFTITVSNGDADEASSVKVKTPFTGYLHVSDNGSGTFTEIGSDWIWDVGTVPANGSRTLIVTTQPVKPGSFPESWAQVSDSRQVDPDSLPGNCENTILTCTEDDDAGAPSADLSLTQVITSPSPYKISDISTKVTFKITITNSGYADATGVQVKDLLPSGLTYSAHVPSTDNYVKGTGLWTIGNLAKNASRTLDITATVSSYGIKTNWAEVWKSGQSDPDSQPGDSSTTDDDDDSQIVISSRSVILNEVAWSGTAASAEDEWIELYNPSNADITLTGWKIKKNGCDTGTDYIALANGGKIAAGGFFLLERGATVTDNTTVLDVAANQIYLASSTPVLSNSEEVLYLCDQNGNIIDTANKNGGTWPKGGGTNYASMERVGNTAESDSVWVTNTGVTKNGKNASGGAIYGTPGAKNSTGVAPTPTPITIPPTAVPIVRPVINEFLARPGYDWNQDGKVDVFDEFIEIKNIGIVDVNLNGWILDDEENSGSAPFKIPAAILKPGQRAIFYALQTNILLGDGGDTVRLINPSGKIYDAYTYALVRLEDQSVCRLPDGGSGWYEDCVPTPNLTNTREGTVPSMPGGEVFESPTCDLPDTLPADFLFAECRGYGADVWRSFYWDKLGWQGDQPIPENMSKWESFVE